MTTFKIENITDFDLVHIFECGQCFRWNQEEDGSYTGIAGGRIVNLQYDPETTTLTLENCTEEDFQSFWKHYLDLDRDYGRIKRSLGRGDKNMRRAIAAGQGIRILNQELWEIILSFLISQNNHIPRIKGCIENLASGFGTSAGVFRGKEYFNLPSPEVLASLTVEDLSPCRLGYRAPYLIETAKQVMAAGGMEQVEQRLEKLRKKAPQETLNALMEFQGVGPKVANCIALFGAGRQDAFPVDVWMRKVMAQIYGLDEKNVKAIEAFGRERFKKYGGFAQQYLFYYIRTLDEGL